MNNRLFRLLQLLVSFGILYILFRKIPFLKVVAVLALAKAEYVLIACALTMVMQLLVAWRLRLLTRKQGIRLGSGKLLEINLATNFYRLFIPGGTLASMAVRTYKLSRADNKTTGAVASIVFDRIATTITLCLVGIGFWFLDRPATGGATNLSMIVVMGGLLAIYGVLFRKEATGVLTVIADSIPLESVSRKIQSQLHSLAKYHDLTFREMFYIFVLSLTQHLLGVLVFHLLGASLEIPINLVTWGWLRSAVLIATMVPISVAGIGIREGAFLYLLKPYGVLGDESLALSLLVFAVTVLLSALVGGVLEARTILFPSLSRGRG